MLAKIEKILFYTFLFLIPFQIRDVWYWGGSEWNSMFLYVGDVVFVTIIALWMIRIKYRKSKVPNPKLQIPNKSQIPNSKIPNIFLFIFLIIAGLSLFFASNLTVGIYRWVKLIEFGLLFLYVKANYVGDYVGDRISHMRSDLFHVLIASGLVQSVLAISQFLKQSSLGLGILEAGVFTPGAPGVATFIMENGEKIMRGYGSFPHPNVLAGFLLLAIFCLYALWLSKLKKPLLLVTCYLLLVFALFLTFSRVALLVFLVMSLVMFLFFIVKHRCGRSGLPQETRSLPLLFAIFLISCIISIAILFPYLQARFFTISLEEQAIDLRFFYNKMAFAMIKERPFLGIGIGNFVWHSQNYPAFLRAGSKMLGLETVPDWIFQPVHNIYLLIAVEMGIIGLIIFLGLILMRLIRPITPITFLIVGFLILGFFDHYFWSLHSGGVMFWLALGLARNMPAVGGRNKFRLMSERNRRPSAAK